MILPDHPTPVKVMTHVSDPVPYIIYDSRKRIDGGAERYTEKEAAKTGVYVPQGWDLMKKLIEK